MIINLLPWREIRNKKRKRNLYLLIGGCVAVTLICSSTLIINYLLIFTQQQQQIMQIQQQVNKLNTKITPYLAAQKQHQQYLLQTTFLNQERNSYHQLLQLLQELGSQMPADVYLTSIQKKDHTFYISGRSLSHTDITLLLKRLENFTPQAQLQLTETRHTNTSSMNIDFDLAYNLQKI